MNCDNGVCKIHTYFGEEPERAAGQVVSPKREKNQTTEVGKVLPLYGRSLGAMLGLWARKKEVYVMKRARGVSRTTTRAATERATRGERGKGHKKK